MLEYYEKGRKKFLINKEILIDGSQVIPANDQNPKRFHGGRKGYWELGLCSFRTQAFPDLDLPPVSTPV